MMKGLILAFLVFSVGTAHAQQMAPHGEIAKPKASDWGIWVDGADEIVTATEIRPNTDLKLKHALSADEFNYFMVNLGPGKEAVIKLKALGSPDEMPGAVMRLLNSERKVVREVRLDPQNRLQAAAPFRPGDSGTYYVALGGVNGRLKPGALKFKVSVRDFQRGDLLTAQDSGSDNASAMLIGNQTPYEINHIGGPGDGADRYEFDAFKKDRFNVALDFQQPIPKSLKMVITNEKGREILVQEMTQPKQANSQEFKIPKYGRYYMTFILDDSKEIHPYGFTLNLIESPVEAARKR